MKLTKPLFFSTFCLLSASCSLFEGNPPGCDSNATREIISEIFTEVKTKSPHYKSSFCFAETPESWIYLGKANNEEECPSVRSQHLSDKVNNSGALSNPFNVDFAAGLQLLEYSKRINNAKLVYAGDLNTNIESLLVKSEKESEDGNSNHCEIKFELKTASENTGFETTDEWDLSITLFKKNDKGERVYEVDSLR